MQPTIHLEGKAGYLPRLYPALRSKCIVGCILNSVGLIITRESLCIFAKIIFLHINLTPLVSFRQDASFERKKPCTPFTLFFRLKKFFGRL
jgi:hypothetical protein